jgi:hypothetical protein
MINGMTREIRYFLFRYKNEVVYQRFENTVSQQFKLDLKLREDGIITQFLPVDNKHHIQFMFYDPKC